MVIEPEVSRVVASTTFSSFLDPDRRSARTTILVEDGETAMIAGLLSQDRDLGDRKVPWLSKIPLLGAAFSRADHTITDTEIVIFITPHIVRESRAAAGPVPTIPAREQSTASVDVRVAERHRRALKSR
jgi:type II secretory pathway component GspD/PulD (secretin)